MRRSARMSVLAVAAMVVSLLLISNPASAEIQALWGAEVVVNGSVQKEALNLSNRQGYERTNGFGYKGGDGSFFGFYEHRYTVDGTLLRLHKVSPDGVQLWEKVVSIGGSVVDFAPDSNGGGIALWRIYSELRAKRYDTDGNEDPTWGVDGALVATAVSRSIGTSYAVTDEADGAIVMWYEGLTYLTQTVYAQRIGSDGQLLWDGDPSTPTVMEPVVVGLGSLSRGCSQDNTVVKDDSGGVFIAFQSRIYDEATGTYRYVILAQHLNSVGQPQWQQGGVTVYENTSSPGDITPDGTGGVIISTGYYNIIINRVDSSGNLPWPNGTNGIFVGTSDHNSTFSFMRPMGPAANGEFVIVWDTYTQISGTSDYDSYVYARKFDLDGNSVWPEDLLVHNTPGFIQYYVPHLAVDGADGVWVAFLDGDYKDQIFIYGAHLSVNHIDNAGNLHQSAPYRQWSFGEEGIYDNYIVPDGTGGIFAIWDGYSGNMRAQRFSKSRPVTIDIVPGSTQNVINLLSQGTVMVAVISEVDFDALTIDGATVLFADAPVASSFSHDVNTDGITDMIFHFDIQSLSLDTSSTSAKLIGTTLGGDGFEGEDSVTIVGGQGGGGGGGGGGQ